MIVEKKTYTVEEADANNIMKQYITAQCTVFRALISFFYNYFTECKGTDTELFSLVKPLIVSCQQL